MKDMRVGVEEKGGPEKDNVSFRYLFYKPLQNLVA